MAEDRIIYKFEGDVSGLVSASKKAKAALKSFREEAKKTDTNIKTMESGLTKMGSDGGLAMVNMAKLIQTAFTAIGAAAAGVGAAIAGVALIIGSVVVAFGALAVGVVAAAVEMHRFILAANDTKKALDPLYELGALRILPKEEAEALENYARIWEALETQIKEVSVAVAGNLAKDLEGVGFEILTISIHFKNLLLEWVEGASLIRKATVQYLISPVYKVQAALFAVLKSYKLLIEAAEYLGIVNEGTYSSLNQSIHQIEYEVRNLANSLLDVGVDKFAEEWADATSGMGDAREEAKKLIAALKELDADTEEIPDISGKLTRSALGARKGATKGTVKPKKPGDPDTPDSKDLDEELKEYQKLALIVGDLGQKFAALPGPAGLFRDILTEAAQSFAEIASVDFSKLEEGWKETAFILGAVGSATAALSSIMDKMITKQIAGSDELTEKQRKNLMLMFAVKKAAALSSIVVDTAGAIVRALNELGPIAGPIAAGLIGAAGAVQAGIVAAEQPTFHTGGTIPAPPGKQGVLMNALPGEAVLNREATAGLGAEGVSALNSGVSNGNISISMIYKHRVFDSFVQDNISKGGPLRDAIRAGKRVGHRG